MGGVVSPVRNVDHVGVAAQDEEYADDFHEYEEFDEGYDNEEFEEPSDGEASYEADFEPYISDGEAPECMTMNEVEFEHIDEEALQWTFSEELGREGLVINHSIGAVQTFLEDLRASVSGIPAS